MARQPARLADFEIPRLGGHSQPGAAPSEADVDDSSVAKGNATSPPALLPKALPTTDIAPAVVRIAPRPIVEARQAMTIRLPVSMHERIRTLMFMSRRSQQDIVEDALNALLSANKL
jgi:hypothetical protein